MTPEIFESSTLSLILSWMLNIPILIGVPWCILSILFGKAGDTPRIVSVFFGVCIFLFSPARYMIFQLSLAASYMVQSSGAFWSVFLLVLYVPILMVILSYIGHYLPILVYSNTLNNGVMNNWERITLPRVIATGLIFPIVCLFGSFCFFLALPPAGNTIAWLKVEDVVKATNGPPAMIYKYLWSPFIVYKHLWSPFPWELQPEGYEATPQQDIDELRCHVVTVYVSNKKKGYFLKHQYPEIYKKAISKTEED